MARLVGVEGVRDGVITVSGAGLPHRLASHHQFT